MNVTEKLRSGVIEFLHKNHREPTFVVMNKETSIDIVPNYLGAFKLTRIEGVKVILSDDLKDGEFLFGIE